MHQPSSAPPQLPVLAFPELPITARPNPNPTEIYDPIRKRFVRLTPEEWVRQHLLLFLLMHRGYPASLTSVERAFSASGSTRRGRLRFDIAIFHPRALETPLLLVECKAASVAISSRVLAQSGLYNLTLRVPLLLLSNGLTHHCFLSAPPAPLRPLPDIPHFESLPPEIFSEP